VADWYVSVPITSSDLKGGTRGSIFFRGISLITPVPFDLERPNSAGHMWGMGVFLGVSHAPPEGGGAQTLPNFGVSVYLCVHSLSQNYQIWRGNTWGRGVYLGVSQASHPKRVKFQRCSILGILLYLCLYPLMQNNQILLGNTYRDGLFLGQPCHCICTNTSRGLSAIAEFLVCPSFLLCFFSRPFWFCSVILLLFLVLSLGCQCQCKWLSWKTLFRSDL